MAAHSGRRRWAAAALLTASFLAPAAPAAAKPGSATVPAPGVVGSAVPAPGVVGTAVPAPGVVGTAVPVLGSVGSAVPVLGRAGSPVPAAGKAAGPEKAVSEDKPLVVGGSGVLLDLAGPVPGAARFEATAGQRLAVLARRKTLTAGDNTDLVIRRAGTVVAEGTLITTWSDVTVDFTAPATGAYTVEVTPRTKDRGTLLLSLAGSTTGTLAPGGASKRIAIAKPGERAFLTFEAAAGRALTLVARRGTLPQDEYTHLEVRGPGGRVETAGAVGYEAAYRTLDFVTTAAGRHTVEINPDTAHTGTMTVQLAGTVTAELTPGRTTRLTLIRPGERAHVTFGAAEGEQFHLTARRDTLTGGEQTRLRLRTPAGLEVADGSLTTAKPSVTLPFSASAGTYTLEVDPEGLDTGSLDLTLTKLR